MLNKNGNVLSKVLSSIISELLQYKLPFKNWNCNLQMYIATIIVYNQSIYSYTVYMYIRQMGEATNFHFTIKLLIY